MFFTLYERVMLPTRVIPADTCRDRFGVYGYDGFNDFSVFSGVSENMLSRPRERIFHNDVKFGKRVLFIEGYPAMDFGCFYAKRGHGSGAFTLLITVRRLALTFQKGKAMH